MNRPFAGKMILNTRPAGQERTLTQLLTDLGAAVAHWPALELLPPRDWTAFDEAMLRLDQFDVALFTSANGVRFCFERLRDSPNGVDQIRKLKMAAIGPATGKTLAEYGCRDIVTPTRHDTESFLHELGPTLRGQSVVLFRAEQGRTQLRDGLRGIAEVTDIVTYRQQATTGPTDSIRKLLEVGGVDVIILTSALSANAVIAHLTDSARDHIVKRSTQILVNSQATAETVQSSGLPTPWIALGSTDAELVHELQRQLVDQ